MKPLVLAVLSALVFTPALSAQEPDAATRLKEMKQKYAASGQKPDAAAAPAAADEGTTIAALEALLLKSKECKKNPADTAQLADNLKGKYGVIACSDAIDGVRQIVLVPKSVVPGQQLMYGSAVGYKLLRARLVDHYLVLQFDKQVQYLDLFKQEEGVGFVLAGFVVDQSFQKFEGVGILNDALKNYAGVAASSAMLTQLPTLTAKAVGGKRYLLQASKVKDFWVVSATSEGTVFQVWPEKKQP